MSASAAVTATASMASRQLPTLDSLLCRSVASMHRQMHPGKRIASMDVTNTHISLALSDESRRSAIPFGILNRTRSVTADAKILSSAIEKAAQFDRAPLQITGLVIGIPPTTQEENEVLTYTRHLLEDNTGKVDSLFPDLKACLFYSEAHALVRAISDHRDFIEAIKILPTKLETKRESLFDLAMFPKVAPEDVLDDVSVKARISTSEVLQAVLDDLSKLGHGTAKAPKN